MRKSFLVFAIIKTSLLLLFILFLLASCQSAPTPPTAPVEVTPTETQPPEPVEVEPTATPPTEPTATPLVEVEPVEATPTEIIEVEPTSITAVVESLPTAVQTHLTNLLNTHETEWTLTPDGASESDIHLSYTVAPNAPSLAHWTLAVVVPFPTITDDISLSELQTAWQSGNLRLTAETAAMLTPLWGITATPPQILPADELVDALWEAQTDYDDLVLGIIPFDQLTPRLKVLRVAGQAPITPDFDPTGYPLQVALVAEGGEAEVEAFTAVWGAPLTNRDDDKITHITLSGPAGMRRAVADRMDRYGMNYPGEETGPILQAADIAHMSNENAFAENCPVQDPFDSENVCNRAEYIALMTWMGIDVNEMTGNHLNDWGTAALNYTFDLYEENGIQTYGGGRNLAHAQTPLLIEHNGHKIAFMGCNPVGPEHGWATETRPGAAPCFDYANFLDTIEELSNDGYLVFVTIQELEDYQYSAHWALRDRFQEMAERGATAVSGSHAHHPQGFALMHEGRFVHYGLGNLLADQMWSLGSRQMFLDSYTLYEGRLLHVDLWTGINEDYARVRQMTAEERAALLRNVFAESDW